MCGKCFRNAFQPTGSPCDKPYLIQTFTVKMTAELLAHSGRSSRYDGDLHQMNALAAAVTTTTTMIATMKYAPMLILVADFIMARLS